MTRPCNAKAQKWRRITLRGGTFLERDVHIFGDTRLFYVGKNVEEVIAKQVGNVWHVPINRSMWRVGDGDILDGYFAERCTSSYDAANDHNTSLFTCHQCGDWLEPWHDRYGTEEGWCGCEPGT